MSTTSQRPAEPPNPRDPDRAPAPWILGVSASHNGATCLLRGDALVVAVQEERLTRHKRARLDPAGFMGLDYCLRAAGVGPEDLDLVVVCPLRRADEATAALAANPRLASRPRATVTHHFAHALSAFALSGFEDAAIVVVDGMGSVASDLSDEALAVCVGGPGGDDDREIVSIYDASGGAIRPVYKQLSTATTPTFTPGDLRPRMMPATSLGVMYQAVAQQIFGGWFDAGKVMGLAPYGRRRWDTDAFLTIGADAALTFHDTVYEAFRHDERWPAHAADYQDLAASVQGALEDAILALAARARSLTARSRLCLAGGVALNSVANERVVRSGLFDDVFVVPAADDAGTAVGAAFAGLWRLRPALVGGRLASDSAGRRYSDAEVCAAIEAAALPAGVRVARVDHPAIMAADLIAGGAVVGWFEGGSELGPRALGHRSILCDARRADARDHLNLRVKHRESFRPYAPAVMAEHAAAWFDLGEGSDRSPFMLRVCPVHEARRALVPGVVHVDGTARLQTVSPGGAFYALLAAFEERTGVPMVVNTSFNVAGEPIVETPGDALRCFASTGIDALAIESWLLVKPDAPGSGTVRRAG